MIDTSVKRWIQKGKRRRSCIRIACDDCGAERWVTPEHAKGLQPGQRCHSCATRRMFKDHRFSKYRALSGVRFRKYEPEVLVVCSKCGKERWIRVRRAVQPSLCKHCTAVQRGVNSKIGIRDENGKTCPRCRRYKPYTDFWKLSSRKDGHNIYCKDCACEYKREREQIRLARKRGNGGSFTIEEWHELCAKCGDVCLACGAEGPLQIDHIVPVSKGGTSNIDNIQPLCRKCNGKKSDKTIDYRYLEG